VGVEALSERRRSKAERLEGDVGDAREAGPEPVPLAVEAEADRAQVREVPDEVGPLDLFAERLDLSWLFRLSGGSETHMLEARGTELGLRCRG
jgi:hypothetical protein